MAPWFEPPRRGESTPDLRGQSFSPLRPVDDSLLSSISTLSAPNPSFRTLVGLISGMGFSAPNQELNELWRWFSKSPHRLEFVSFPSDEQLRSLATRLEARITLAREAHQTEVAYTFQIQPLSPTYRGIVLSFSNRMKVSDPSDSPGFSELSVKALPNIQPDSRIAALREALRLLGVTRAAQVVERENSPSFGMPSADIGVERINFLRQNNSYVGDPGEQYRLGQAVKCIMCEGIGKDDFEYVLALGKNEFRKETLQKLWDRWLVDRPHMSDKAFVATDRQILSAARELGGLVGLMREATPTDVSYGLMTVILSGSLNGLRTVVFTPGSESLAAGYGESARSSEKMHMRLLGGAGLADASRARVMTRLLRGLAPEFRLDDERNMPEVVELGRSSILCSRDIRLILNPKTQVV